MTSAPNMFPFSTTQKRRADGSWSCVHTGHRGGSSVPRQPDLVAGEHSTHHTTETTRAHRFRRTTQPRTPHARPIRNALGRVWLRHQDSVPPQPAGDTGGTHHVAPQLLAATHVSDDDQVPSESGAS